MRVRTSAAIAKKTNINTSAILSLCLCLLWIAPAAAKPAEHGDHADEDHGGEGGSALELAPAERDAAGIDTEIVTFRILEETLRMPAEVVINAYRSARVTPRISAQILARHVQLGDTVVAGQPLVTLSSVAMAQAQGSLIVANREWQRVSKLGRGTVSAKRYIEAQVAQQQAFAKVQAYGLTQAQARELMKSGSATRATGEFDLLAPQAGTILSDEFIVGELIEPGRVLIDISDESLMWVEARTHPNSLGNIQKGAPVAISVGGMYQLDGRVIQRHHRLDETTRTQGLRIEVDNVDDQLHPGQFVEVEVTASRRGGPVLAVPQSSITLIAGEPTVFKLEGDTEYHPQVVVVGDTVGDWTVIRGGIEEGDEIAVGGIFFLKSLLLKSSLGEGHAD